MSKSARRPQRQKNPIRVARVQEIRRSNAAGTHGTVKDYRRKPKHVGRGWDV